MKPANAIPTPRARRHDLSAAVVVGLVVRARVAAALAARARVAVDLVAVVVGLAARLAADTAMVAVAAAVATTASLEVVAGHVQKMIAAVAVDDAAATKTMASGR